MTNKLSIIIPCYNCQETLTEAVESIFRQGLEDNSFEIVMVDDGSTDETWPLLEKLATTYKEIKILRHSKNLGGGATRNTAVEKSTGNIIFCLDSDDILGDKMLSKMLALMLKKESDGIIFAETRFFKRNTKNNEVVKNTIEADKSVQLENLFQKNGFLTQVNFMYTRESFYQAGQYPENHGFDTQSFGFRFLAKKQKVYLCPNTFYYHRRNQKKKSYFERVYEAGDLSLNMYLIYEDIIDNLSDKTLGIILNYNIFRQTELGDNNLRSEIEKIPVNEILNYDQDNQNNDNRKNQRENIFRQAIKNYHDGQYQEALDLYEQILKSGFISSVLIFNLTRCSLVLAGEPKREIEKKAKNFISSLTKESPPQNTVHRIFKFFKKTIRQIIK